MKNLYLCLFSLVIFMGCKNDNKNVATTTNAPTAPITEIYDYCYLFTLNGDSTFCQLTIGESGNFSGYYAWIPKEKDSQIGLLVGLNSFGNDTLHADFKYIQEGEISNEIIHILKKGGNLVLEGDTLKTVDCTKIQPMIMTIKERENYINSKNEAVH